MESRRAAGSLYLLSRFTLIYIYTCIYVCKYKQINIPVQGFGIQGFGFRDSEFRIRDSGLGVEVLGMRFRVKSLKSGS